MCVLLPQEMGVELDTQGNLVQLSESSRGTARRRSSVRPGDVGEAKESEAEHAHLARTAQYKYKIGRIRDTIDELQEELLGILDRRALFRKVLRLCR